MDNNSMSPADIAALTNGNTYENILGTMGRWVAWNGQGTQTSSTT